MKYNQLYEIWKEADREATEAAKSLGLAQAVDMFVIYALATHACLPQINIVARYVRRAPTSFTPVVDRLTEQGLIERETTVDRRSKNLMLTEAGAAMRDRVIFQVAQVEEAIMAITQTGLNGKAAR